MGIKGINKYYFPTFSTAAFFQISLIVFLFLLSSSCFDFFSLVCRFDCKWEMRVGHDSSSQVQSNNMMMDNIYRASWLLNRMKNKKREEIKPNKNKFFGVFCFTRFLRSPGRNPKHTHKIMCVCVCAWYTTIIKVILSEHQQQGALIMVLN